MVVHPLDESVVLLPVAIQPRRRRPLIQRRDEAEVEVIGCVLPDVRHLLVERPVAVFLQELGETVSQDDVKDRLGIDD